MLLILENSLLKIHILLPLLDEKLLSLPCILQEEAKKYYSCLSPTACKRPFSLKLALHHGEGPGPGILNFWRQDLS